MLNMDSYPKALQLLMNTDGTVTELIKLIAREDLKVIKLSSDVESENVLLRKIYLQGRDSGINWLYAESEIYLANLNADFMRDLIENSIPIGTLWMKYRMETFKELKAKQYEMSSSMAESGFARGTPLLSRTYDVYNSARIIMKITEKFPVEFYAGLLDS